ncbi:MAG: CehA/McbA family metallohydrolase [Candidatus Omnitrophota bacterium]|nr:CehA/McbA family metallohydrolase [Candidatus Omnitrophota bacterium]
MKPLRQLLIGLIFTALLGSGCALMLPSKAITEDGWGTEGPYRGVFHVHSEHSHDSAITFEDARKTAKKANLDFVVITDHNNLDGRAAYADGEYEPYPLLVLGTEITTGDGHLIALGIDEYPQKQSTKELVKWIHDRGGYVVAAHPLSVRTPWTDWSIKDIDGFEVYNFGHAAYTQNKVLLALKALFYPPHKFLKSTQDAPLDHIRFWEQNLTGNHTAIVGAADAHIHFEFLGMSPENLRMYFESVTTYVIANRLEEKAVVKAIGEGRSYLAFEVRGDASGFTFTAVSGSRELEMGDTARSGKSVEFKAASPGRAWMYLIKNGQVVESRRGTELRFTTADAGVYRVEVHKDGGLWILSNPIYVEP